jgi:hypothetical protein
VCSSDPAETETWRRVVGASDRTPIAYVADATTTGMAIAIAVKPPIRSVRRMGVDGTKG